MNQLKEGAITHPDQKAQVIRKPILEALWAIKHKGQSKDDMEDFDIFFARMKALNADVEKNAKQTKNEDPQTIKLELIEQSDLD